MILMIKTITDELISRVKSLDSMSGIRFKRGFPYDKSEKKLTGFLAVVYTGECKTKNEYLGGLCVDGITGRTVLSELKLRLYCGSDISGSQLTEKTEALAAALKNSDSGNYIDSVSFTAAKTDSVTGNAYRDIDCRLSFNICEV